MTVLVPPLITHRADSHRQSGSFVAQVLSLDIVGFSEFANLLMAQADRGAETLAAEMNATFAPIFAEIASTGGEILAITGDSVTAIFSGITPKEIDHCAERLINLVSTASTVSLTARIGIATEEVSWFVTDEIEGRRIYGFDGPAMSQAAFAQSVAKPQTVVREPVNTASMSEQYQPLPAFGEETLTAEAFLPAGEIAERGRGQFRHAITAFVRLPEEADQPQIQNVLEHALVLKRRFGGVGARLDSDDKGRTLFLFWGAPSASENDKADALNFLLALQKSADIPLQIGAAFGMVFSGLIGGVQRAEYTCYGKIPNLAARLMMAANPNQILIDAALAEATLASFEIEPMSALQLKGFAVPMECHVLNCVRETPIEEASDHVGRDLLLEHGTSSLRENGASVALLIEGEPGIGKSHFLKALRRQVGSRTWIDVRCTPRFDTGFAPIRQLLEGYLGAFHSEVDLEEALEAYEVKADAASLWLLFEGASKKGVFDPNEAIGRLSEAVIAVAQAPAFAQAIVVIEDLHWLDGASASVLTRFIARQRRPEVQATKIVMTTRPDGAKLGKSAPVERLVLPVMSDDEAGALLKSLLGAPVSRRLTGRVQQVAQGNPLFIRQLALLLRKTEVIAFNHGMWRLLKGSGDAALPTDVRSLLVARIDRLTVEARRIVNAASIFGRTCAVRDLEDLLESAAPVEALAELAEAEILEPEGADHLSFHHALFADTAYDMQLTSERATLHCRIYERLRHGEGSEVEKGRHAEGAGETALAISHYSQAAETANSMAQPETAALSTMRALNLVASDAHRDRFDLLLILQRAYAVQTDLHRRDWVIAELKSLVEHIGGEAEVAVALGTAQQMSARRDYQSVIDYLGAVQPRMVEIAKPTDLVGLLLEHASAQMYLATETGFKRSLELAFEALEHAKTTDERYSLMLAHRMVGLVHRYARDDIAGKHFQIALSLSNSPLERKMTSKSYASVLMRQGNFEQAMEEYSELLEHALDTGSTGSEMVARKAIADVSLNIGAFKEAEHQATVCQSLSLELGDMHLERDALFVKMHARIQLGHLSDVLAIAGQAQAAGLIDGSRGELIQVLKALALDLLGQHRAAEDAFQKLHQRATSEGRWLDVQNYDLYLIQSRSRVAPSKSVSHDFDKLISDLPNTPMTSRFVFYSEILEDRRLWMQAARAAHLVRLGQTNDVSGSELDELLRAFDDCVQSQARLDSGPGRNILTSRWISNILTVLEGKNDPRYSRILEQAVEALKRFGDLCEAQDFSRASLWAEDIYRKEVTQRATDAGLDF